MQSTFYERHNKFFEITHLHGTSPSSDDESLRNLRRVRVKLSDVVALRVVRFLGLGDVDGLDLRSRLTFFALGDFLHLLLPRLPQLLALGDLRRLFDLALQILPVLRRRNILIR